jgi:hypothetical protein
MARTVHAIHAAYVHDADGLPRNLEDERESQSFALKALKPSEVFFPGDHMIRVHAGAYPL